jgi:hypothetical protein
VLLFSSCDDSVVIKNQHTQNISVLQIAIVENLVEFLFLSAIIFVFY